MNKNALMNYALWARKELENQISLSLNRLGFYKTGNKKANIVGDYTIIEGTEETFPKAVYSLRNTIFERHILENGFDETVEEFAYTWFNRIIALRFMEVHDYFNHGFRVLTSRDGSYEPEILQNVDYVIDDLKLDAHVVHALKEQGKEEDLYRYILFSQCNSLSDVLPMLFDTQEAYMELLLPGNLLSQDSVIRHITDIPEEDFENDVEVIGWLYQFYNSVKKDEVNSSKKPITKDTLPAVTQLFTPDWIVRYMAQNSVGRIWLEAHPNSSLRQEMKYYVEDAPQDPETQKKLDEIKYKNLKLENLTIIEPCCGSGHILVYVFDLLFEMYKEEGYLAKDIPAKILSYNLFGLDVDRRAAQLSQFALVMKARSIDSRFFNKERYVCPHVYELQDSKMLSRFDLDKDMRDFGFSPKAREVTKYLVETFQEGKTIGSLLKVKPDHYLDVANELERINADYIANIIQQDFQRNGIPRIICLCKLAYILSNKYDVMITNPPYRGTASLDRVTKEYILNHYSAGKDDMYSAFIQDDLVKSNGFKAMITMQSWLFLKTYQQLRQLIFANQTILSVLHLETHSFPEIKGEVVKASAFIVRNVYSKFITSFYDLSSYQNTELKEKAFLLNINKSNSEIKFNHQVKDFEYLNDYSILYRLSDIVLKTFSKGKKLGSFAYPKQGMATSDNERFVRYWFEVSSLKTSPIGASRPTVIKNNKKWVPYNKGGHVKKWYGNNELVVNWENNGEEIRNCKDKLGHLLSRPQNLESFFLPSISYSDIRGFMFGARQYEAGFAFDSTGPSIFNDENYVSNSYLLAFLNSKLVDKIYLPSLCTSTHFTQSSIAELPVIKGSNYSKIEGLGTACLMLAKQSSSESETSRSFNSSIFQIYKANKLNEVYKALSERQRNTFYELKEKQQEINYLLCLDYGLSNVCDTSESDDRISIPIWSKREFAIQMISYSVGCLMGRYSPNTNAIVYAGGEWNDSKPEALVSDSDGILPIGEKGFFSDDIVDQFFNIIKLFYGESAQDDNLKFIGEALGGTGSSKDIIHDYFCNQFYADHINAYQKRPIYWMLNSGKHKAFQCLFYLHRYTPNTLAIINTKYFLPRTAQFMAERERLETQLAVHELDQRTKRNLEKRLDEVKACQQELFEYGQVLDHLANQYIELDLDDGVKVNYEKFQHVSVEMDGRTVTKDLLVPIK